ncbi:lipopolysaccharide biosynthesis protein, partial [Frankia sp. CNm7]|nr:lipopolysaccharide biosynthesis protein [Frankia nepalensis]
ACLAGTAAVAGWLVYRLHHSDRRAAGRDGAAAGPDGLAAVTASGPPAAASPVITTADGTAGRWGQRGDSRPTEPIRR